MATAATISAPLSLAALPYPENALEPLISGKTLSFHHDRHHRAYIETPNKLIVGTELADLPLDQIVTATVGKADHEGIFHNAAQTWNHNFYWHCLKPKGGGEPPAVLKPLLTIDVWEHAYYLDYQNKRADHVNAVIDKLANWEFAAENLTQV